MIIGGEVRKIAILTVQFGIWACFLARKLRSSGVEVFLISQSALRTPRGSWKHYRRLLKQRGLAVFLDNILMHVVKSTARMIRGTIKPPPPDAGTGDPGSLTCGTDLSLDSDPGIRNEDGIHCFEVHSINRGDGRKILGEIKPDLILLAGAPILSRKTISMSRVATLNPHCGITPAYAGSAPIIRAIYEKQFTEIGYTIHLVVPKVDGGPVIHQERVDWDPSRPTGHLWPMIAEMMYVKLAEISLQLINGKRLEAVPQENVRTNPPSGLFVRILTELRRRRFASVKRKLGPRDGR